MDGGVSEKEGCQDNTEDLDLNPGKGDRNGSCPRVQRRGRCGAEALGGCPSVCPAQSREVVPSTVCPSALAKWGSLCGVRGVRCAGKRWTE